MKKNLFCRGSCWFALAPTLSVFAFVGMVVSALPPGRLIGTVTSIDPDSLTVRTDAGDSRQIQVSATTSVLRVSPGQKDLSAAEPISLRELAIGDRILVKFANDGTGSLESVVQIVAIKQSDVARKQQEESEEWQKNGVSGLVKSVDPTAGIVVLTSGAGVMAKSVKVHILSRTVLKRYAPASTRFDQARPAPLDAIRVGDQMRARGEKNAEGTEVNAEEVVSGSFRSVAGTISALDVAGAKVAVKDLATKKPVTILFTPEAQLHRLPEMMARIIAARLTGNSLSGGFGGFAGGSSPSGGFGGQGGPPPGAMPGAGPPGDIQQMLNHAPVIQLANLRKGEAVMVVASQGEHEVKAIILLAGVEALLQSPDASRNLLSNWSISSGSDASTQ